jgi:hypothetical protein
MSNPLRDFAAVGQAVRLDYLRRRILEGGELSRLVETDGVTGLAFNPANFQKAIGQSDTLAAVVAVEADLAQLALTPTPALG